MCSKIKVLYVRLRPFLTFTTAVYGLLATTLGSIPLLSLVQKILSVWNWNIELLGLPKLLLAEYQRLRSAALKPIIDFLSIHVSIPDWLISFFSTWVADFLAIYMLLVLSVVRGSMADRRFDRKKFRANPEEFKQQLRSAAALHGRDPDKLIADVEAGLQTGLKGWLRFQWRVWKGSIQWPFVIKRNLVQLHRGIASELAFSRVAMWGMMVACAVLGVIGYLLASVIAR
jgi:hypothetical protein